MQILHAVLNTGQNDQNNRTRSMMTREISTFQFNYDNDYFANFYYSLHGVKFFTRTLDCVNCRPLRLLQLIIHRNDFFQFHFVMCVVYCFSMLGFIEKVMHYAIKIPPYSCD